MCILLFLFFIILTKLILLFSVTGNKRRERTTLEYICRYSAASCYHFVVKRNANHSQKLSFSNKLCLQKIDPLLFELSGFKQRTRQTGRQ
jgi:hypothetical protein